MTTFFLQKFVGVAIKSLFRFNLISMKNACGPHVDPSPFEEKCAFTLFVQGTRLTWVYKSFSLFEMRSPGHNLPTNTLKSSNFSKYYFNTFVHDSVNM